MARIVPIEIKSNDLLNLKSIDEKINKAVRGLRKETEELYGELANDFNDLLNKKNEEVTENLYDALTSLNEDLQKQIDGEVTAWFLQGPPCDEYGTIYTNKEPVCDWSEVKEEGKDTYKQHEGDTYTDISTFVDNETTPTAGQSWRFCFCERVIDENNTKVEDWHWHKIADSDAVKALYEAGLAQMTAEGKATIFISKDKDGNRVPNNYQIGDMWVINDISLQYGNFDRTSGITKGDLLIANATSVDYVSSHWGKELKYTDDTIANEALVAANSAITAANEAHVSALQALNELAEVHADGKVFKNEMKDLELRKMDVIEERNELVGEDGNGGEAGKWEISVDYADEYYVASNNAISSLTYYSSVENCDANCDYITIDKSGSAPWSSITVYYSERQKLSSQIADVTRAYSETVKTKAEQAAESATSAKAKADEASKEAKVAKGQLDDIDEDSVIARTEFATLETQLENIEDDLIEIKNSIDTYEGSDVYNELLNEFNNNYKPSYNNAINALKYHCGKPVGEPSQTATTLNENNSIIIKSTLSSDDVDYDNDVIFNGVNVDYNNIFLYYEKRQTILNLIAQKVKAYAESLQMKLSPENIDALLSSVKIGGVNIIKNSRTRKFTQWESTTALTWNTVENVYCSTIINENSRISFCNVLYAPNAETPVFDITDMQWGGEYISASVDLSIQEGCVATHHDSNPNKAQLELYFRNSADTTIFSAVTTAQTIVYGNNNKDKWNRLSATWKMDKDVTDVFNENDLVSKVYFIINGYDIFKSGTEFKIRNVQFEFATTPSAWSPAPEDIESGIEGVYSIAEDAQKNANAALEKAEKSMNQLNAMSNDGILSVQEKIDVRREWSEIQYDYNQCFANSEQIWENEGFEKPTEWTNYHNAYSALSDYISKKLDLTGTTNTIISGHTGTVNGKTYKGKNYFNAIFADYYTQHNNFMNAVAEQLAYLEVLSLEVGGTNLLKDSDFKTDSLTGFWIYNSNESVPDKAYTLSYDTTNKCLKVVTTKAYTNLSNNGYRLTLSADLRAVSTWSGIKSGENYMLSFDVWADKATEMRCYIGYGTSTTKQIGTEKTRFVAPIKHSYTGSTYYQNIFILVKDICTFYIDNVKLEKGNMASDWSPAPEDTLEQIKEIRTYTDNLTKTLGDSLQKQIDGVVNSYFMEGAPCDTDGTVRTTIEPFSEWKGSYTVSNKIYTLKPGEINYLMDHLGDTYTDISDITLLNSSMWEIGGIGVGSDNYKDKTYDKCKYADSKRLRLKNTIECKAGGILFVPSGYDAYVSYYNDSNVYNGNSKHYTANGAIEDKGTRMSIQFIGSSDASVEQADTLKLSLNPTAGQSWRWCDITSTTNHETTAKYITVKYTGNTGSEISKNLHWHKIADSDAVKALQAAAAAQDTADGKRRVFTNQPYGPYDVGDLWVKTDNNNSGLADTLYCTTSASTGWNSEHWVSSTAAEQAYSKANSALTVANNAIALANGGKYLQDVLESGSTLIKGGLVLTNVLALQNNTAITAGMSGREGDNVLLWGGGTYDDAKNAAINNYNKSGSTTNKITTLLKKDGTGKIGAFYIDDDTVKVVTDTNTIIITNQDNTKYTFDTISSSSNSITYISEYAEGAFVNSNSTTCFSGTTNKTITINNNVTFSRSGNFKLIVDSFNIDLDVSGYTGYVTTPSVGTYLEISINSITYILKPKTTIGGSNLVNKKYDFTKNNSITMSYGSGGWVNNVTKTCQVPKREFSFDYNGTNIAIFEMRVVVNLTSTLNTGMNQGRLTWNGEIKLPSINTQIASTEKYTIFSKSGISIIDGSNNYFHINNSDGMEIKIKGLPKINSADSLSSLDSGQLYVNNGNYLMVKP